VKLAIEGGCNAVASTFGVLGSVARKYAHKIPFMVKINHNELLTYPNKFDQIMFGTVEAGLDMGAVAVGATIYFGSRRIAAADRRGQPGLPEATSSAWRPCCGATCATARSRRTARTTTSAADLTGQANHLGVTIEADIIKQKLPENSTAATTRSTRRTTATASPTSGCTPTSRPITRSTSRATRSRTATWAAPA
jgi:class I fructose-bisphosphate aldolase